MKESTKQIGSVILAGSLVVGTGAATAVTAYAQSPSAGTAYTTMGISETVAYIVQKGDTLSDIAFRFSGNANNYAILLAINPEIEDPDFILEGQSIRIPISWNQNNQNGRYEPTAADTLHIVQKGETLYQIVTDFYKEESMELVYKVATRNNKVDPHIIYEGEAIYLSPRGLLDTIESRDYTLQDQMLEWRLEHPNEPYPDWILQALGKLPPEQQKIYIITP